MLTVRICGVKICFDFSFFAVLGLFLAFDGGGYGWLCFAACVCHELGHLAAMAVSGEKPREMIFSGGGICIKQSEQPSLGVLSAGCGVNFLLFAVYFVLLGKGDIFYTIFGGANLFVGIFNLLPVGGLDGHGILENILLRFISFEKAQKVMGALEIIFGTAWIIVVILLLMSGLVNLTAVIVMIYIFVLDYLWRAS